jgi:hypothetical protein
MIDSIARFVQEALDENEELENEDLEKDAGAVANI